MNYSSWRLWSASRERVGRRVRNLIVNSTPSLRGVVDIVSMSVQSVNAFLFIVISTDRFEVFYIHWHWFLARFYDAAFTVWGGTISCRPALGLDSDTYTVYSWWSATIPNLLCIYFHATCSSGGIGTCGFSMWWDCSFRKVKQANGGKRKHFLSL